MKTEKDDLKSLFQEVKLDQLSVGFESRLMEKVHIASEKKIRRRSLTATFALAGGVLAMVGIPSLIFWWYGLSFKIFGEFTKMDIYFSLSNLKSDSLIISIVCVVFLLLVSDTLIRKRIWDKKHKC